MTDYWSVLLFLTYLLVISGVISNLILIRLVVCKSRFDVYCRIGLFLLSLCIITYLLSYSLQVSICLCYGTMFKTDQCSDTSYQSATFLYTLSAITFFTSQDAFTIERIISIRFPKFHETRKFGFFYIFFLLLIFSFSLTLTYFHTQSNPFFDLFYGLTTQILVFSNLPLMLYAQRLSRQMYRADVSSYDLTRKHQLFNSYEITRSFVFALLINYGFQGFVMVLGVMFKKGKWFFAEEEAYKMEFIVQILWNINHTVYPWSVILFHRGQRGNVMKSLLPCLLTASSKTRLTSLDGKQIVANPTQNDYFQQMKVAWTAEHKF